MHAWPLPHIMIYSGIPSVSALPDHQPHIREAAAWLYSRLQRVGLEDVRVLETEGPHPVVYGAWLKAGPAARTILIYGHYDVQVRPEVHMKQMSPFPGPLPFHVNRFLLSPLMPSSLPLSRLTP